MQITIDSDEPFEDAIEKVARLYGREVSHRGPEERGQVVVFRSAAATEDAKHMHRDAGTKHMH